MIAGIELEREQRTSRALPSIFENLIRDKDGRVKRDWTRRGNLRTTAGIDWQSAVMGNVGSQPAAMGWLALTADATAPAVGDTTLASEITTNGFARAAGTYAHTGGSNTFTISHTFTATGTQTINKEGVFNASSVGTLGFESAEPSPPTLVSGDTLAQTVTITF